FQQVGNKLRGTLKMPPSDQTSELEKLNTHDGRVYFESTLSSAKTTWEGKRKQHVEETIEGRVSDGPNQGTFQLTRIALIDSKQWASYFGIYQVAPDRLIWVGPFEELGAEAAFVDFRSGRIGALYGSTPSDFFSGPAIAVPLFPVEVRVKFVKDVQGKMR